MAKTNSLPMCCAACRHIKWLWCNEEEPGITKGGCMHAGRVIEDARLPEKTPPLWCPLRKPENWV